MGSCGGERVLCSSVISGWNPLIRPLLAGEFSWCPDAPEKRGPTSPDAGLLFKYFTRGLLHRVTARGPRHFLLALNTLQTIPRSPSPLPPPRAFCAVQASRRPSVYPGSREVFA